MLSNKRKIMRIPHCERRQQDEIRYIVISVIGLDSAQMNKLSGYEIKRCMTMHLLVFKPRSKFVSGWENVCNYIGLELIFENCDPLTGMKTVSFTA